MDTKQLTSQIDAFRIITGKDEISPESLGALLQSIVDKLALAAEKASDAFDTAEVTKQIKDIAHRIDLLNNSLNSLGRESNVTSTRVDDLRKGIKNIGHFPSLNDACAYAARSEISGNRDLYLIKFTYTGAAGKVGSCILQAVKGDDVSMQYLFDKCTVMRRNVTGATGVAGGNVNAFSWGETFPHTVTYTQSSRQISMKNYEGTAISSVTLPLATSTISGLMSSSDKVKIGKALTTDNLNKVDGVPKIGRNGRISEQTIPSTAMNAMPFAGIIQTAPQINNSTQVTTACEVFYCLETKSFFARYRSTADVNTFVWRDFWPTFHAYGTYEQGVGVKAVAGKLYLNTELNTVNIFNELLVPMANMLQFANLSARVAALEELHKE